MSRLEENELIREAVMTNSGDEGTLEELNSHYLGSIVAYLDDISKSLAVIADNTTPKTYITF